VELATAFFADSVIVQDGKFYAWGGGIDTTYAAAFPAHTNFSLVVRIAFDPSECGQAHKLEVNVIDEDGKPYGAGSMPPVSMPPQAILPQKDAADGTLSVSYSTVLGFQGFPFDKPCKVVFSIVVDRRVIGSITYRSVQMVQAPAPGWHSQS
jgi:hypothetical protein